MVRKVNYQINYKLKNERAWEIMSMCFEYTRETETNKGWINCPLISVIVPVYKVKESYLRTCIESLICQTLKEIEIILVDDGSPDNCGAICDEYAQSDDRIHVIHKKNEGVCKARNTGINRARGQYISFLDADDWIESDTYRYTVQKAIEYKVDLVSWNHYYNYETGEKKEIKRKSMPREELFYSEEDIRTRLIYDFITPEYDLRFHAVSLGAVRGVWGKLYKLDIIRKYLIEFDSNLKIGEDACFNIEYAYKIKNALFINKYFNHYRILESSANHRMREDIEHVRVNLLKKYKELIKKHDEVFWMCYSREVISSVINCMTKYYCVGQANLKFNERIRKVENLLSYEDIACIAEKKKVMKENFFKISERILLWLICSKNAYGLYLLGNIIKIIKDR